MRRQRQSIEQRKRVGLAAQGRAGALSEISDPRLRRAIEALTSLENYDLDAFEFTTDGKLTISMDFVAEAAGEPDDLTVESRRAMKPVDEPALEADGTKLYYTQLPARADIASTATTADIIVRINAMLEDERRAGHRERTA